MLVPEFPLRARTRVRELSELSTGQAMLAFEGSADRRGGVERNVSVAVLVSLSGCEKRFHCCNNVVG